MKKSLVAVALLGAFAGSSMAADVTLYGKIDTGLNYQHKTASGESTDAFTMAAGQSSGSRWGMKGTEDLGNGMKVGFVLESGFTSDDGKMGQGSRLFGREASLNLTSDFGKLTMGRTGALSSGLGSTDVIAGFMAFSTGWSDTSKMGNFGLSDRDRMDNTVTYQTPRFAGVRVSAQYSFQVAGQETERQSKNKRYAGLGVDYTNGAFATGLTVDTVLNPTTAKNSEDSLGVTLGASYDFEVAKVFGIAGYAQNENKFGTLAAGSQWNATKKVAEGDKIANEGVTGYWGQLGVTAPVAGGKVLATVSYSDAEDEKAAAGYGKNDAKAWGVGLAYQYNLSKRTYAYTFAGYNQTESTVQDKTHKTYETEVGFGLCHNF